MFLSSLAASWIYNSFLSSLENEKTQGDLLCKALRVEEHSMKKYRILNRRSQAVFACSILSDGVETNEDFDAERMLSLFIPNRTRVWSRWRAKVGRELKYIGTKKSFQATGEDREGLGEEECRLLNTFLGDAQRAYDSYRTRFDELRSLYRGSSEIWDAKDV
ncbi:hypothetical protein M405DRAFT_931029 [Rhizopogon salebrosus TDB-379]|nr:hypothetical protein M405DRAFT_931029 [Rhizopogon salebrosus TDB-379]